MDKLILCISLFSITLLLLSTILTKISSGLQYKNQGFLLQISAAFSVAPITQGVSPPSVEAISKSFSVNPKSYIC